MGEAAADFMQLRGGEYRSVYGEDKEDSKCWSGSSANKGGKVCKVDALLPRHAK